MRCPSLCLRTVVEVIDVISFGNSLQDVALIVHALGGDQLGCAFTDDFLGAKAEQKLRNPDSTM